VLSEADQRSSDRDQAMADRDQAAHPPDQKSRREYETSRRERGSQPSTATQLGSPGRRWLPSETRRLSDAIRWRASAIA
jgi:hypothetical protein